ncbi:MAG: hypothetical protein E7624_09425 [Ruminococcaceae bacterium]|nr:hypothetical protein [Oscillospiraceae bacterium]
MRKLYVPIMVDPSQNRDQYLKDFEELGVGHVFLSCGERWPLIGEETWEKWMDLIEEAYAFYTGKGYACGVWISTIGFGGALFSDTTNTGDLTQIRSIVGKNGGDALCPSNETFVSSIAKTVQEIARRGVKMIMLDDELCLSVRPGIGCACDWHLKEFSRLLGEEITLEQLPELVFTGKANKYRKTWLQMQGDTLRGFCRTLREALDEVDPTVRMGFCAGYTSFDTEGVDALELTHILAGNTAPFMRFTSAPYWHFAQRFGQAPMQTFIEYVRMQDAWAKGEGIELFAECDTYPHNRFHTPVAHIECFDTATMLTKNVGVLKYFYHYPCQPTQERGYINAHLAARSTKEAMQQAFHTRPEVGVRVYEEMHKLQDATLPEKFDVVKSQKEIMYKYAFSEAQQMLTVQAIPTVYEGTGLCGICFGENAKYLPEDALDNGLILDVSAAELLQARGIDVGLLASAPLAVGVLEDFADGTDPHPVYWANNLCDMKLAPKASVSSTFVSTAVLAPKRCFPACYRYENAKGQRFLVYGFRAETQPRNSGMYWSYGRGAQLGREIPWLCGKELPVRCEGHPFLYARCNEDASSVAVAYFNCAVDGIEKATLHFARDVKDVKFIGCKGEQIDARTVELFDVRSFGCACVEAEYQ